MQLQLPQFPLNIVVFPGEELPLHIFEPRYRQLIHDCVRDNLTFGITPVINQNLKKVGTEVMIADIFKEYDDGQMDIVLQGIGTYEILHFSKIAPDKLYGVAEVVRRSNSDTNDPSMSGKIRELATQLFDLMQIKSDIEIPDDPYLLGHKVGLSIEEEFVLLSTHDAMERQQIILDKLQQILPKVYEMDSIRKKIEMNGHFRYLKPPNL